MTRYIAAAFAIAAVALGSVAAPASAAVPCQDGDVQCYRMCYLPHYEKPQGIYWVNC